MKETSEKKPSLSMFKLRKILLSLFAGLIVFTGGYYFGRKASGISSFDKALVTISRQNPVGRESIDFQLFWDVWDLLDEKYFDKDALNQEQMVYGAIRGMVAAVGDPYTVFLPPEQNKVVQEDLGGSFEGVGIQIGFRSSRLVVIAPLDDSPAQEAGVRAGDYIVGITDEEKGIERGTAGISLHEAVQAIRGKAGSHVMLTLLREGSEEPLEVDIERRAIDVPTLTLEFVGENEQYAHLRLSRFGEETTDEWTKAVREILIKDNVEGIIVDVRNNPGGYLNAAQVLAGDFLEIGDTTVIQEASDGERLEYTVETIGKLRNYKTVVLMNEGSASASEILSGALRDEKGIKLIGGTSFGKGTIQEPVEFEERGLVDAGLHITIARWLTPSGFWVNEGGLKPDVEVEDNQDTEVDEQLEAAIAELAK